MAVGNSLANRQQKTGLTAYLKNDAVKNQINNVVGGDVYKRQTQERVQFVQLYILDILRMFRQVPEVP